MGVPLICKKCKLPYYEDLGDDSGETGPCYHCFEDCLEQHEIDKRRKIERNEW
jgi:hypothetical protein